tara:strand:- start:1609 stop:2541 length:933 start_codon:yes stop_codon:yes gene_type:complete
MSKINNILKTIGNTPLLKINSLSRFANIYAKLEFFNPGGSIKDRTALYLINEAEKQGLIHENSTIIEPTAGNTGIGLSLVAAQKNYKVICVVPKRFSEEKQVLMKALGAKIINTPTSNGMEGAIKKSFELKKKIKNSFIPQQFSNPANIKAHYETTGKEIYDSLNGKIDIFIAGIGTAGTFMGVSKYLKEKNPHIKTIGVEPEGSVLAKGKLKEHKTEGIGVDKIETSKLIDWELIDEIITVSDRNTHKMLKFLAKKEGLLIGSSSGATAWAAYKIARLNPNKNIVTIFPDGSNNYLSKNIYGDFDAWKI